jgi:MFS transporter, FHS family, L-fucose permease
MTTPPTPGERHAASDATMNPHVDAPGLRGFVVALFFFFGGITSLNDILIPKLRELFTLSHADGMLVQSAFFAAYFVVSLPAAAIVRRIGYMRTAVVGLSLMTVGCLLFIPASKQALFPAFLAALFVLASGVTIVQVVANPLISMLGDPATVSSRLTFAQAFNSLGTTIFPRVGSMLILSSIAAADVSQLSGEALAAYRSQESNVIVLTYIGLATALAVLALVVWMQRDRLGPVAVADEPILAAFSLLTRPRFGFGALCIFLYVGAEVAIGSAIVSFLVQPDVLGVSAREAGDHVWYYWGGAMVGRFVGSYFLSIASPGKILAGAAAVAIGLLSIAGTAQGATACWALLAIGLFNSIMFPTIFSLASEGLGKRTHEGSGIICIAIVGGAIVPLLLGEVADAAGLRTALLVPAVCYAGILAFGVYARRPWAPRPA